jgi:GT2 family glycosyltransferase
VKRSVLQEKGLFFDERLKYTGDFDWLVRLVKSGLKFHYVNKVFACVRIHAERASIVYLQEQKLEHARLLQKFGISHGLYAWLAGVRYLRSVLLETITMLGHGHFRMFGWRFKRWLKNKFSDQQENHAKG